MNAHRKMKRLSLTRGPLVNGVGLAFLLLLSRWMIPALCASHEILPDRIHQIAAWLPPHPAGFGWPVPNRVEWDRLARNPARLARA